MKKLILLFLISLPTFINSQNVGINNSGAAPHPSALLDVNSANKGLLLPRTADPSTNIASPATGLMTYNTTTNTPNFFNGSQWQSVTAVSNGIGFKNMKSFFTNEGWTIPAGVNKIMLEAWGSGGRGGTYLFDNGVLTGSGGGAGGYAMNIVDVVPGDIISVEFSSAGSITIFKNYINTALYVFGGYPGNYNGSNAANGGDGSNYSKQGENGHDLEISYGNQDATMYNLIVKLGDGGDAYNGGKGGKGQTFVSQNSSSLLYTTSGKGKDGGFPGGGGGAGYSVGGNGGSGVAYIYY